MAAQVTLNGEGLITALTQFLAANTQHEEYLTITVQDTGETTIANDTATWTLDEDGRAL